MWSKCLVSVLLFILAAFGAQAQNSKFKAARADTVYPYKKYYCSAHFLGGETAMLNHLAKHLHYPDAPKESNIEGRVIVRFLVSENGVISRVSIVRSLDPSLDAEAMRVVRAMPKWVPASYKGRPVRSVCTLPVVFKLQ